MRRLSQVLALLGLMLWPMESHAQSEELTEAIEQGQRLLEEQSYGEAVPFFRKALGLSEREFGPEHAETVELLNSLAGLYFVLGRYADAELLLERVVGIRERNFGPPLASSGNPLTTSPLGRKKLVPTSRSISCNTAAA